MENIFKKAISTEEILNAGESPLSAGEVFPNKVNNFFIG